MHPERELHDRRLRGLIGSTRRSGFNAKDAALLSAALDKLRTNTPTVPLKGKNLVFAQPTLVAEIEFRGWSNDGKLRHASYKGLREVQDNAAVFDMTDRDI